MTSSARQWLKGLGLPQYADAFEANHIDVDLLPSVNDQVLKDIGVESAGHRLRILAAAARPSAKSAPRDEALKPPPQTADGERRQATVLIADISGYTALCRRLDPEQVQALLSRFYAVTDGIVANYGGYVVDHAGDGTFAVFGAPIAHDNDIERAVRAALDMQAQVSAIADPTGQALKLHAGIASGEVVAATIGTGAAPKYAITGEAVNLAARLSSMAQSGQTLIADAAWQPVSRTFDAQPLGEMPIKGIDRPPPLWNLQGLRQAAAELRPLIGRQTELRQLFGALDAAGEGRGLAVCVLGEAGIGKSRLVEALREQAQKRGFACHTGFVLDFGMGKGQDAISAVLKGVLEVGIHSDEATLQAGVQRAVSAGLISSDQQVLVNDLLELAQSDEQRAVFDAMDNATRMQRRCETFAGLLRRSASRRPCLILVEDIHWASQDLLRYLALLNRVARESRIVLVMTSRFEGYPLDKAWRALTHGSPLMTVDLGPLRPEECRLLATGLMQRSNQLALECIERSDGNPLFLEQLLRNAAESEAATLPASIQSLVLARMDRLRQHDKAALQTASVIGKRFGIGALQALLDDPAYACDALIDADLVRPEGADYVFAHALIQEGVYSSLLTVRKRELHRRAADWFGDDEPILRAEHLDRAADPAAGEAYLAAARAQAARFRHESALRLADRGLETAPADAVRCSLLLLRGDLLREAGKSNESLAAFKSALGLAPGDAERCQAWMGIVAGYRVTSDVPAAMAALDEAQAIAERLGVSAQRSRIDHVRGNLLFATGDSEACRRAHESALHHARVAQDAECEAQALGGLGDAQYLQGRMLSGLDYFTRCVALCERAGLIKVQIPNRCMVGHCMYYANRMDESIAAVREGLEEARRIGQAQTEIFALNSLGLLLAWKGEYRPAEQALTAGMPLARAAGARRYLAAMLCALAEVRLAEGARDEAGALLDEALEIARQSGMAFAGAWILSVMACAEPNGEQARRLLAQGETELLSPCVSHCHLHFYRNAIDVSLRQQDWRNAARYAAMLEQYVRAEPLPWAAVLIERALALATAGSGERSEALLDRLQGIRAEITRVGIWSALPGVDRAIAQVRA
ncbi:MAG: AAA family ATPase [Burkholderiales bacterium]|nr:MAG: AAA family ATPase [Burkholderiales bacterium]